MTGVHGANRLASNSLLEGLVFGRRVADDIRKAGPTTTPASETGPGLPLVRALPSGEAEQIRRELRALMSAHVGIIRSEQGLGTASPALPLCSLVSRTCERRPGGKDRPISGRSGGTANSATCSPSHA